MAGAQRRRIGDRADRRNNSLLTAQEELDLVQRIAAGESEARNVLVECNQGLVHAIARDYVGRGLDYEDLVGEGNLGLLRATAEFNPAYGVRFGTYAAYWIKQAIRAALVNLAPIVRVPCHVHTLISKWKRAEHTLAVRDGKAPSSDEVAALLDLTPSQRLQVELAFIARDVRSDSESDESSSQLKDELPAIQDDPQRSMEHAEELESIPHLLRRLDQREQTILRLRYGLEREQPMSFKEVGRRVGVTREWARRIEAAALVKLREISLKTERQLADAVQARPTPAGVRPELPPTWDEVLEVARGMRGS